MQNYLEVIGCNYQYEGVNDMKRITMIIIITVLSTVLLAKNAFFKGRVIFTNKDYIEVKYGKTEKQFYVNDKSVFKKG
ncbi:MAG TPA: hypothetical protein PK121_00295, partial [Candidatus Pacearchaeota archaeon]|nr:hypothetical protein [Candidatus Pacearchaeota archaeon]